MRLLIILLLASPVAIATAAAAERTTFWGPGTVSGQKDAGRHGTKDVEMTAATPLDRVATAVDSAESSHGRDPGMWRPDPSGPQGPMQVSAAAATDVGGGDRLDLTQNREIGRAYLARLYGRYRNWPDTIAAYNWGIGKMDAWVKIGRPPERFLVGVTIYLRRVLHDNGFCNGTAPNGLQQSPRTADRSDIRETARDSWIHSICTGLYNGPPSRGQYYKASMVAQELVPRQARSRIEKETASARSSWMTAMRGFFGCTITPGNSLRCR
jgi:hypothetical protein